MGIAMENEQFTPDWGRTSAVYAGLTSSELAQYAGEVIAVSPTGEILGSADTVEALREFIECKYTEVCYRTLPVADLSHIRDIPDFSD